MSIWMSNEKWRDNYGQVGNASSFQKLKNPGILEFEIPGVQGF